MDKKKKYKVIIAGLPKSGTSTLAVMFRMLGYKVSGPVIDFERGDIKILKDLYNKNDAFQDYPWCFEWRHFVNDDIVKFIILHRDKESWWNSFLKSYGKNKSNYLSFPYLKMEKSIDNKNLFLDYHTAYYEELGLYSNRQKDKFLNVDIKTITWEQLCSFLNERPPTTLFGKVCKIPHANKMHFIKKRSRIYRYKKSVKNLLMKLLGKDVYFRMSNLIKKASV